MIFSIKKLIPFEDYHLGVLYLLMAWKQSTEEFRMKHDCHSFPIFLLHFFVEFFSEDLGPFLCFLFGLHPYFVRFLSLPLPLLPIFRVRLPETVRKLVNLSAQRRELFLQSVLGTP